MIGRYGAKGEQDAALDHPENSSAPSPTEKYVRYNKVIKHYF